MPIEVWSALLAILIALAGVSGSGFATITVGLALIFSQVPEWFAGADMGGLLVDVAIPVAAILVPTLIAINLSSTERRKADDDRREERRIAIADREGERRVAREERARERRLEAGAGVIEAVAPLAFIRTDQDMQEHLWQLRARIAVYRAWIGADDRSGDWLELRHREQLRLWTSVMASMDVIGGPEKITIEGMLGVLHPAHEWAANTTEMFTGFLSGQVSMAVLLDDEARILEQYPAPGTSS